MRFIPSVYLNNKMLQFLIKIYQLIFDKLFSSMFYRYFHVQISIRLKKYQICVIESNDIR